MKIAGPPCNPCTTRSHAKDSDSTLVKVSTLSQPCFFCTCVGQGCIRSKHVFFLSSRDAIRSVRNTRGSESHSLWCAPQKGLLRHLVALPFRCHLPAPTLTLLEATVNPTVKPTMAHAVSVSPVVQLLVNNRCRNALPLVCHREADCTLWVRASPTVRRQLRPRFAHAARCTLTTGTPNDGQ